MVPYIVAVEWAGPVALLIEIVLFGFAAFYLPRRTPSGRAADFERRFAALQEEIERQFKGLKNDVLDVLEREERLHERARKRVERASGVELTPGENGLKSPVDIMRYAREKGMIR